MDDLLVWGDVGYDDYPDGVARAGGCALNVAVAAVREGRGLRVAVAGALGEDGAPLRARLVREGVDASALVSLAGPSPRQPIRLLAGGERELRGYRPGVLSDYQPPGELRARLASATRVYLPLFPSTLPWAHEAAAAGANLACDLMDLGELSPAEEAWVLERAEVVFCGVDLDHPRLPALREWARADPARALIATFGRAGACGVLRDEEARVPAAPVPGGEVLDTTGCGDAFAGAFLARWGSGAGLRASLEAASEAAARVAAHVGSCP
ncbi:MAG TPA: hypothetical protein DEA08_25980 [Planctomycetes bacterium]|nr:hypothetical protein [Planctomycetota bacterium]